MNPEPRDLHKLVNQLTIAQSRARLLVRLLNEAEEPLSQELLLQRSQQLLDDLNRCAMLLREQSAEQ